MPAATLFGNNGAAEGSSFVAPGGTGARAPLRRVHSSQLHRSCGQLAAALSRYGLDSGVLPSVDSGYTADPPECFRMGVGAGDSVGGNFTRARDVGLAAEFCLQPDVGSRR